MLIELLELLAGTSRELLELLTPPMLALTAAARERERGAELRGARGAKYLSGAYIYYRVNAT